MAAFLTNCTFGPYKIEAPGLFNRSRFSKAPKATRAPRPPELQYHQAPRPPELQDHQSSKTTRAPRPPELQGHQSSKTTRAPRPPELQDHQSSKTTKAPRPSELQDHQSFEGKIGEKVCVTNKLYTAMEGVFNGATQRSKSDCYPD